MPTIQLRGQTVDSVFELLGRDENSMTFALGWCMGKVPKFLDAIAVELEAEAPGENVKVRLQEHGGKHGITDIEVVDPGRLAWIFEAKAGFEPPGPAQLSKYATRLLENPDTSGDTTAKLLVVLAKSDRKELWLKMRSLDVIPGISIPVRVLSWGNVLQCIEKTKPIADNTGKGLLRQLSAFLEKVLSMQTATSNLVFIVSANREKFGGITTFIDVIEKHRRYFHPVKPGWPNDPPNYIAFRWEGRLQSIHHIDDYEVIADFSPHFPGQESKEIDPHYLYHLGPPIVPPAPVPTGNLYAPGHHWAHIDLLLTSATVSEARDKTQEREAAARKAG